MKKTTVSLLFVMLLFLPLLSISQDNQKLPEKPGLSEKVFQITYADLGTVFRTIRTMVTPYGRVSQDELGKKLVVRDTAESLAKISTLIKDMDIAPHRLQLTVFVFEASTSGTGGDLSSVPPAIKKALEEVKSVMMYKNFTLKTSGMLNAVAMKQTRSQINLSDNLSLEFRMDYNPHSKFLMLNEASLMHRVSSQVVKDVQTVKTLFQTDFGIGDGEVVVAGASRLNGTDKALLTVVTLKVKETK